MSSQDHNLSTVHHSFSIDDKDLKIGIVVSEWNTEITTALFSGCKQALLEAGIIEDHIYHVWVPGSFELPLGAKLLDGKYPLDAIICLGCVIKGETSHNEYINKAVSSALMQLSLMRNKPFVFGVLTPNDEEQAKDRSGGKYGNKGIEAAQTALKMIDLSKKMQQAEKKIGFK
jgi:6,7-dimethyl-8-ribityllumazine synthase